MPTSMRQWCWKWLWVKSRSSQILIFKNESTHPEIHCSTKLSHFSSTVNLRRTKHLLKTKQRRCSCLTWPRQPRSSSSRPVHWPLAISSPSPCRTVPRRMSQIKTTTLPCTFIVLECDFTIIFAHFLIRPINRDILTHKMKLTDGWMLFIESRWQQHPQKRVMLLHGPIKIWHCFFCILCWHLYQSISTAPWRLEIH